VALVSLPRHFVQVEAPPFLDTIAQQLLHAGQQLRLLAGLPEHIAGTLVAQLTASASTEAEAAAAAAGSDPWAAGALQWTGCSKPCCVHTSHRLYHHVRSNMGHSYNCNEAHGMTHAPPCGRGRHALSGCGQLHLYHRPTST
jgi:hypothetical protein